MKSNIKEGVEQNPSSKQIISKNSSKGLDDSPQFKYKKQEEVDEMLQYTATWPRDHPLARFRYYIFNNMGGGKQDYFIHWFVNLHKGLIVFVAAFMMFYYNNYTSPAYAYLFIHGSYGLLWLIKDVVCPDKFFHQRCTLFSGIFIFVVLGFYMLPGWAIISRNNVYEISNFKIFICSLSFVVGEVLMIASDTQKYFTLKYKKGLVTDGFFSKNRNPNFLGEILVYGGFSGLSGVWYGFIPYILFILAFVPMPIYLKEISLRRKDGAKEYFKNTYIILFKLFESHIANILFYISIILTILFVYCKF